MKYLKIIIPILISLLSACYIPYIVSINTTDYRILDDKTKQKFIDFNLENFDKKIDNSKDLLVEEVTVADIKKMLTKHKFTCVELWSPHCHAEVCQNLHYYDGLVKKYKKHDFKLLKISRTYNYENIKKVIINNGYEDRMYVIKHNKKRYTYNIDEMHDRFTVDLTGEYFEDRKGLFYFRDTTFIHASDFITEKILDSLVNTF